MTDLTNLGNMICRIIGENIGRVEEWQLEPWLKGYYEGQFAVVEIHMDADAQHRLIASDALKALKQRIEERISNARNDKRAGREVQD